MFSSENNSFAQKTYLANFGETPEGDITKIDEKNIPKHDLLLAGFPCQPFSLAGVSKKNSLGRNHGFKDRSQGVLFFEIVRILQYHRPKVILLENVKNLLHHNKGQTFHIVKTALEQLDYQIYFKVLDGKDYVPQHRERLFIVGFHNNSKGFQFPEPIKDQLRLKDILEREVDEKYTLTDKLWNYLQAYSQKHKLKGNGFGYSLADLDGVSRTLSARYYKDGSEILIPQKGKNPRRLTPRECARLQGYPDDFTIPVSDTQAYQQFGNSVIVPLIEAIGLKIIEHI